MKKSLLADLFQKALALNLLELLNLEGTLLCHRSFFHMLFIVAHFMIISMTEHISLSTCTSSELLMFQKACSVKYACNFAFITYISPPLLKTYSLKSYALFILCLIVEWVYKSPLCMAYIFWTWSRIYEVHFYVENKHHCVHNT